MKGIGGERDVRDDGVNEKEATLIRNEEVMQVTGCAIE
jgi:hypothetical protein